jgi:hypothetical protein
MPATAVPMCGDLALSIPLCRMPDACYSCRLTHSAPSLDLFMTGEHKEPAISRSDCNLDLSFHNSVAEVDHAQLSCMCLRLPRFARFWLNKQLPIIL